MPNIVAVHQPERWPNGRAIRHVVVLHHHQHACHSRRFEPTPKQLLHTNGSEIHFESPSSIPKQIPAHLLLESMRSSNGSWPQLSTKQKMPRLSKGQALQSSSKFWSSNITILLTKKVSQGFRKIIKGRLATAPFWVTQHCSSCTVLGDHLSVPARPLAWWLSRSCSQRSPELRFGQRKTNTSHLLYGPDLC